MYFRNQPYNIFLIAKFHLTRANITSIILISKLYHNYFQNKKPAGLIAGVSSGVESDSIIF